MGNNNNYLSILILILGRVKSDIPKQVMFSDGIRPGGDLTDLDGSSERILPIRRLSRSLKKLSPTVNSKFFLNYNIYHYFNAEKIEKF